MFRSCKDDFDIRNSLIPPYTFDCVNRLCHGSRKRNRGAVVGDRQVYRYMHQQYGACDEVSQPDEEIERQPEKTHPREDLLRSDQKDKRL